MNLATKGGIKRLFFCLLLLMLLKFWILGVFVPKSNSRKLMTVLKQQFIEITM